MFILPEESVREVFTTILSEGEVYGVNQQRGNFQKIVEMFGEDFRRQGLRDGQLGLSGKYIRSKAMNRVNFIKALIEEKYRSLQAALESRKNRVEAKKERAKKTLEKHESFLNDAFDNQYKYSFVLGALYLIIAIFLILADIPLALKLTQIGFDLDLPAENDTQAQLINFFQEPIYVFVMNWEVFILAMGLAFCTIFIKSYYDEHVAPSPKKRLRYKRAGVSEEEYLDKKKEFDKLIKNRFRVQSAILFILVITIFSLGIFRSLHSEELHNASG
ncbi:MAG: hypothetical protein AAFR87_34355, partial [Bacteroidota bacterium]